MSIKINADARDRLFFTSDQHYGHDNVIKFCKRPFKDAREMNEELIRLHNERVPKDGIVFHLGDFAFKNKATVFEVLGRLHGAQHYLIEGNHDKAVTDNAQARALFTGISKYERIFVDDKDAKDGARQLVCLFHYPIHEWDCQHHASWHLHGHTHNGVKPVPDLKRMDAGVDNPLSGYAPFSYAQVKAFMATRSYTPLDKEKPLGAGA